ncbi:unnamed protein product [Lepeophtheirus salmonis]|uniref:(salmon louse) hypothetical protein n=1 Tax=Lepeophtheirus salmonis TaxID=72036 RepID=A0A7R8CSE8_LEPSM|nr:unnamed protein product [Lepeophtheirus salmonis]CAF2914064.1 unnamed protein product [Lepeophtheirus salmonis]
MEFLSTDVHQEILGSQILLFCGIRTVIPSALRKKFLEGQHLKHRGTFKIKTIAHCNFWWPNIDFGILNYVNPCTIYHRPMHPLLLLNLSLLLMWTPGNEPTSTTGRKIR